MTGRIRFAPLRVEDLELLDDWFVREHVARWWPECQTPEQVRAEFLPALEGRDPCDVYLIELDERPVGLIQTYLYASYAESAHLDLEQDVAGVDLFVGEAELLGRGLGPRVLEAFLAEHVFARADTIACAAEVDVRNERSLRAFAKAGFRRVRDVVDPNDGITYALMRRDRSAPAV
jgi:RimJ/RimL family protein N-acetyltransferase